MTNFILFVVVVKQTRQSLNKSGFPQRVFWGKVETGRVETGSDILRLKTHKDSGDLCMNNLLQDSLIGKKKSDFSLIHNNAIRKKVKKALT